MSDTLTVDEFAQRLPCSRTVAYQLYSKGEIRGFKVGGRIRIYTIEVQRYRQVCSNKQPRITTRATGARKKPGNLSHLTIPD